MACTNHIGGTGPQHGRRDRSGPSASGAASYRQLLVRSLGRPSLLAPACRAVPRVVLNAVSLGGTGDFCPGSTRQAQLSDSGMRTPRCRSQAMECTSNMSKPQAAAEASRHCRRCSPRAPRRPTRRPAGDRRPDPRPGNRLAQTPPRLRAGSPTRPPPGHRAAAPAHGGVPVPVNADSACTLWKPCQTAASLFRSGFAFPASAGWSGRTS